MTTVRRIITGTFYVIGTWVTVSFIGVMLNPANAGMWTTSLMWSLLASLVVLPGLVVAHHASESRRQKREAEAALEAQPPFIEDEHREGTLWSPSEEEGSSVQ